ncbi:pre-mRNA splicing factor, putative [Eimeria maxima]|uniref:Pre-mRNA splicing factor, putative n=1 Tax=Eimeria maxima TaxID=5804 RepID=U6MCD8_EIMMA|nr:pre-mRNA splicing factor, putative [Eimeria maxima]CDJ61681.1 pre-mRNA splicing factor, putative [Eimeria maxima]
MDYFASYAEAEDGSSEVSAGTSSPPQPPSDKQQQQQQQQQEQQEEEKQQDEQQQQQQQQEQQQHLQEIKLLAPLNSAPATTQGAELSIQQKKRCLLRPEDTLLNHNPKVIDTEAPIVGPLTPLQESQGGLRYIYRQRLCGDVSAAYLSRAAFNAEYNKFAAKGYAADPSDGAAAAAAAAAVAAAEQGYYQHIVEAPVRLAEFHPQEIPIVSTTPNGSSSSSSSSSSSLYNSSSLYSSSSSSSSMEHMSRRERKAKRPQRNTDVESADYEGPWALYIPPGAAAAAAAAAAGGSDAAAAGGGGGGAANGEGGIKDGSLDQSLDRGEEKEEEDKNKKEKEEKEKGEKEEEENKDCIFHIKNLYDYQGRSWIEYNGIIDGEEDKYGKKVVEIREERGGGGGGGGVGGIGGVGGGGGGRKRVIK